MLLLNKLVVNSVIGSIDELFLSDTPAFMSVSLHVIDIVLCILKLGPH